jgi:hypothetical protein
MAGSPVVLGAWSAGTPPNSTEAAPTGPPAPIEVAVDVPTRTAAKTPAMRRTAAHASSGLTDAWRARLMPGLSAPRGRTLRAVASDRKPLRRKVACVVDMSSTQFQPAVDQPEGAAMKKESVMAASETSVRLRVLDAAETLRRLHRGRFPKPDLSYVPYGA